MFMNKRSLRFKECLAQFFVPHTVFLYGIRAVPGQFRKLTVSSIFFHSSNKHKKREGMALSLNVGNFVTLKLTQSNYPLWCEQILALAESQDLSSHLTDPAPDKFVPATSSSSDSTTTPTTTISPTYQTWHKSDRLLRGWIIGTLSEESLGLVVGLDSASAVWQALQDEYAQDSQEREFTLRQQLVYLRKGEDKTLRDHIHAFKGLCDNLAAIGKPVADKEKVFYLLTSLGTAYEHFATTMLKPPLPTYKEVVSQLQNLDQRRSWVSSTIEAASQTLHPHLAFTAQQHRVGGQQGSNSRSGHHPPFTSAGRGFSAQQSGRQQGNTLTSGQLDMNHAGGQRRPPPPGERRMTQRERDLYRNERCQYCGTLGHIAKICWWIPKKVEHTSSTLPQALSALTLDTTVTDTEWMTDTGASNHMTGTISLLKNLKKYYGSDSVLIGDGTSLEIKGVGDTEVQQKHITFPLHDVLYVPALTKNLISVSQLTSQFPVNCEFSNDRFYIKDRATGHYLMTGTRRGDLYMLPTSPNRISPTGNNQPRPTYGTSTWVIHKPQRVQFLSNKGSITRVSGPPNRSQIRDSCQLGKISRLPFLSSEHTTSKAFDKVHCDLWGPAPVQSIGQFRYYACLVDDFSRYTWFIPLRRKSDFFDAFLQFEKYVLRQFNTCIKIFHSDGGGEFVNKNLSAHFQKTGIIHQLSCPYTPEQTGMVERRHRTVRELGMTMLFHSGAPLFLWVDVFMTVVYLMNRLPCASLDNDTPYFKLHATQPQYSMLRVFGSKCFPYTWDTKKNKFDPKTVLCVFTGYSKTYKGYKCFDPTTRKLIISRHVIFDE
ncbi:hypothetical protein Dimus_039478 [Dionaea muscipula]